MSRSNRFWPGRKAPSLFSDEVYPLLSMTCRASSAACDLGPHAVSPGVLSLRPTGWPACASVWVATSEPGHGDKMAP